MFDKFKEYILNNRRKMSEYLLLFAGFGVLLIILGGIFTPQKSGKELKIEEKVQAEEKSMEDELKDILSKIKGVGEVEVYVSFYESKEEVYISDEKRISSGEDYEYEKSIVMRDTDNGERPIKVKELEPRAKGAIVVAEGGDKAHICDGIIKGVKSVTGLEEYQIQVYPLK